MEARAVYTGRCARRFDGYLHFAEVDVSATPTIGVSSARLSAEASAALQAVFGADAAFLARYCLRAGVEVQIGCADVAGEMPLVGQTAFDAEVVAVRVSGHVGRERSGFLLTVAAMEAIAAYLLEYEEHYQLGTGLA